MCECVCVCVVQEKKCLSARKSYSRYFTRKRKKYKSGSGNIKGGNSEVSLNAIQTETRCSSETTTAQRPGRIYTYTEKWVTQFSLKLNNSNLVGVRTRTGLTGCQRPSHTRPHYSIWPKTYICIELCICMFELYFIQVTKLSTFRIYFFVILKKQDFL